MVQLVLTFVPLISMPWSMAHLVMTLVRMVQISLTYGTIGKTRTRARRLPFYSAQEAVAFCSHDRKILTGASIYLSLA